MKKICLITILLTIIILLSGCEKKDNALLSDRSLLTKVVYNSIVANNEDYKNQKLKKTKNYHTLFLIHHLILLIAFRLF